jgi:hypothetical protein
MREHSLAGLEQLAAALTNSWLTCILLFHAVRGCSSCGVQSRAALVHCSRTFRQWQSIRGTQVELQQASGVIQDRCIEAYLLQQLDGS